MVITPIILNNTIAYIALAIAELTCVYQLLFTIERQFRLKIIY